MSRAPRREAGPKSRVSRLGVLGHHATRPQCAPSVKIQVVEERKQRLPAGLTVENWQPGSQASFFDSGDIGRQYLAGRRQTPNTTMPCRWHSGLHENEMRHIVDKAVLTGWESWGNKTVHSDPR